MTFYLLVFVVALTSFFGIVHSQTAREKLHLQAIHDWSVETLHEQIKNLEALLAQYNSSNRNRQNSNNEVNEVRSRSRKTIKSRSTGSIEEIEGSRQRHQQRNYPTSEKTVRQTEEVEEEEESSRPAVHRFVDEEEELQERDKVLAAINASLRRLSKAAVSGRLNGAQLYDILLQETRLHERAAAAVRAANNIAAGATTAGSSNYHHQNESNNNNNNNERDRDRGGPRMYFGESPLEYVPHHSN